MSIEYTHFCSTENKMGIKRLSVTNFNQGENTFNSCHLGFRLILLRERPFKRVFV